jgi:hypothetical protein
MRAASPRASAALAILRKCLFNGLVCGFESLATFHEDYFD